MIPDHPIFTTEDLDVSTESFYERLVALRCSKQYAREAADARRARLIHITFATEGNEILCGKRAAS